MTRVAIGVGSNLGDPPLNVRTAFDALEQIGEVVARSHLYRSKPWGKTDQPDFCNAVAIVDTALQPGPLLGALKALEAQLGRVPGERWGPRLIDLDILTYGDRQIDEPGLRVPHPRLHERGFALVPLAEVDPAYTASLAGLPPGERESVALMSEVEEQASGSSAPLVARVRELVQAFLETDLVKLRIEDPNEDAIEVRRHFTAVRFEEHGDGAVGQTPAPPVHLETIKADLVGIFHLTRPLVSEGDTLEGDRELAYVEALGIRNPVRSLGGGRVATLRVKEGQPVEYGQVLFEIDRG